MADSGVYTAKSDLGIDEIRQWAYLCVDGITDRCDEINDLNVFPIADSDTGTNLMFTVRAAVEGMRSAGPAADVATVTSALARGAVSGARGNSGVIISQLLRALAEECSTGRLDGRGVQRVLSRAAALVLEVVSVPVKGTMVTVLAVAAEAASAQSGADLVDIIDSATSAAAVALDETRSQLSVLDAAGVVDAGALGLVIVLDALAAVVTGTTPSRPRYFRPVAAARAPMTSSRADDGGGRRPADGYEVLYRVTDIGAAEVSALRRSLSELGDSVVVAGDGAGTWSAHVHTSNAGLAVETGLALGRLHDVRIDVLRSDRACDEEHGAGHGHLSGRDILAVVAGDGAELLFVGEGAAVLRCDTTLVGTAELCAAIVGAEHTEVLVLPNGALSAQQLVSVSIASRTAGKDVLMLPSSSMVQGLAALAVHDPSRAAVDDAFAMSEAAAGTRWASIQVASERSLTWVGTCEPGDGLGLVGREVVVIGADVVAAGCALIDQLLSVGGEMVTMLLGESVAACPSSAEVGDRLAGYVADRHPGVEVVVYAGGQPGDVIQLGVE